MFQNVSKCFKTFQNVSKCFKMFQNVSKCFNFHFRKKESHVTHRQKIAQDDNSCEVTLRQLDWLKFEGNDFKEVDVILGTDIVYERTILPALCNVIRTILVKISSSWELGEEFFRKKISFLDPTFEIFTNLKRKFAQIFHSLPILKINLLTPSPTSIFGKLINPKTCRFYYI